MIGIFTALFISQFAKAEILSYLFDVTPDFKKLEVSGKTTIRFKNPDVSDLIIPTGGMSVDDVRANGKKVKWKIEKELLSFDSPKKFSELKIAYHGKPSKGLVITEQYAYTDFNNCQWMFCNEDPGKKVKAELNVKIPEGFDLVKSGEGNHAMASYLYGFAVGKFNKGEEKIGDVTLKFFSTTDSAEDLQKKLGTTKEILKFFEDKAGVPFPHKTYSQIIVPEDEAQEKDGFSLLGKRFIDPILQDPKEDWIIVHELAHEWWGNSITCKEWKDFWLNEAVTTFMTAAWKQQKWGEAAYQKEIELAKSRYQFAIDAKFDKSLTFGGDWPSLRVKRAIVYSKGFLFLDQLRSTLGEEAFWKGIKTFTQKYQNSSPTSSQFQNVMEEISGKKLNEIFSKFVL